MKEVRAIERLIQRADVGADVRVFEKLDAESRWGGKGSHNDGKHASNVGVNLLECDAGLDPGETVVTEVAEINFVAVKLGRGNQRGILVVQEMKPLRQDADDLPAFAIHDDVAAKHRGVAAKFAAPIAVGEHDGLGSSRRVVLFAEAATEQRRNAKNRESAVGDTQCLDLFGLGDTGHAHGVIGVHANILKGVVLFAINEVVGGRHVEILDLDAGCGMPGADQLIWIWIGQGLEENAFEDAENNGVGPYAGGQCDEGNGREHRRTAQPTQDLFELILEGFHGFPS